VADDAEAPEWYRNTATLRKIPLIAAIVVAAGLLLTGKGSPPPALTTSCTTPAFALSTYSTESHKTVAWSVTGPAGSRVALTIGVARFTQGTSGLLSPVPDPGVGVHEMRSTPPTTIGDDCTAHGDFGVALPSQTYTVRLFTITGRPGAATAEAVAQKSLRVI
jgi:hypothetical protein